MQENHKRKKCDSPTVQNIRGKKTILLWMKHTFWKLTFFTLFAKNVTICFIKVWQSSTFEFQFAELCWYKMLKDYLLYLFVLTFDRNCNGKQRSFHSSVHWFSQFSSLIIILWGRRISKCRRDGKQLLEFPAVFSAISAPTTCPFKTVMFIPQDIKVH